MALVLIPATEAASLVDATPNPIDRVVRRGARAVLGRGIVRPFRRDDRNDFANAEGLVLVQSCVGQILAMRGSTEFIQGELEWDPDRGSLLHLLRHQKNTLVLQELGRTYIIDALRTWEPRVIVKNVRVTRETGENGEETVFLIRLRYDVIATNVPGNAVLFADVGQRVSLPAAA
jgi:phage baseplate assembly protein W